MDKKNLLIMAATASVVIAAATGLYYWDAIAVGLVVVLLWAKKLLTFKGLLMLLKKLPFLLLLGLKRLIIKVTSHFLLFTAHLRFHRLQRILRYLRVRSWRVKRRLKFNWQELSGGEQVLATVAALPLVVILLVMIVVYVVPRAVFVFLGSKLKEHSSAAVLNKAARLGVKDRLDKVEQKLKAEIRRKLSRSGGDKEKTEEQKPPPADN